MIDCEKCMYRKNGGCGYDKNGCGFVPKTGDLIRKRDIDYILAPIAPVLKGEKVHYEYVAFRKQIEDISPVPAITISVIEQIKAEIQDIKNSWSGREYLFDVNDGFDALFKVIEKNIKEYTE